MDHVTMSRKEIKQIGVFDKLKAEEITQVAAARMLNLTTRQVRNKIRNYQREGPASLVHKRRGTQGNRAWNREIRDKALALIMAHYADFGPTFAAEKLAHYHAITINKETLRREMIKEGVWNGRKRKSTYRKRRERKKLFGEMIQLDGSHHDWFEGRGPKCVLLVFIDDATSKIVWAQFVTGESVENLMSAAYNYFTRSGLPLSFYVDNASVFKVNVNNPERKRLTQFGRAASELGIQIIYADTPQAKGRVERVNRTLQDRLIKELRLAHISTMDEANQFLEKHYLDRHNAQFAVPASVEGDAHRPLSCYNLDHILCIKEKRVLANDFTLSYQGKILQIQQQSRVILRPKDKITVLTLLNNSLALSARGVLIPFTKLDARPTQPTVQRTCSNAYHKPAPDHPWRRPWSDRFIRQQQMEVI